METKKYEYIDSLRGIAILLVIMLHTQFIVVLSPTMSFFSSGVQSIIGTGFLGVNLFFLVSAFTLTMSHQRRQFEDHAILNFFIRRFFRIAPMYYLAIVYFSFSNYLGFDFHNMDLGNIPKKELFLNLIFANGLFPHYIHNYVPGGWSITVEFTFYAIFPFLFTRIKTINGAFIFTFATLLFSTVADMIIRGYDPYQERFLRLYIIAQLPVFSLGMLAYRIITEELSNVKIYTLICLTITVLIYCYIPISHDFLFSIVFFLMLLILSQKQYKLFSNKILARIGKVSFSMYLLHFVALTIINRLDCFSWVKITGTLSAGLFYILGYICLFIMTFIFSNITYQFVELPGQNLGKKIIEKLNQRK